MTTWQLLLSTWHSHPSVLLGCWSLLILYMGAVSFRPPRVALLYVAGIVVLLVALLSPIHELGDTYLFSAHMLQHLLLVLIVPPLLLLGIPQSLAEQIVRLPLVGTIERVLRRPLVAGLLGSAALWVWHIPFLYNAALEHPIVHIVEHLFFLVAATIWWWPVVTPLPQSRLAPPLAMIYVFTAMASHTVLGIILTFAPVGLYPAYLQPVDTLGILPLLRNEWGLTPAADQQLGGLLMWVPGNIVYFIAFLGALARWYRMPEEDILALSVAGPTHDAPSLSLGQRRS